MVQTEYECHHVENGSGSPTGVAIDDVRAGNQASSRPEPLGVAAERAWIPRRFASFAVDPIGWHVERGMMLPSVLSG